MTIEQMITPSVPSGKDHDRPGTLHRQMHYQPVDRCFNMEFGYWTRTSMSGPCFMRTTSPTTSKPIFLQLRSHRHDGGHVWMHPQFPREVVEVREIRKC